VVGSDRKTGPLELDRTDRQILALLRDEGRRPNTEIARTIGVSEPTVRKRVDRMLQDGVLKVLAVLNEAATSYSVDAIIGIRVRTGQMRPVGRQLADIDQVAYVGYVTGSYDIIIEVLLRTSDELLQWLSSGFEHTDGIVASETFTVLNTEKLSYMWLPTDVHDAAGSTPADPAQQPAAKARSAEES
jgi:Lrp/AsnC family transcriptional regulator for asnA, asnC and gidA